MRRGTAHLVMPENIDAVQDIDEVLLLAFDFEDDMPQDMGPARTGWHADVLDSIHAETGVYVADLLPLSGGDPDYAKIEARLNAAGFDTYDSDTRLEVYRGPVVCSPECGEDCHRDDEPAGAWVGRMHVSADMLGHPDDANPHGITRPHLRDLDPETLAGITCDGCGRTGLDEYACPLALKHNEPTCLDCCGCPEHVADAATLAAVLDPENTGTRVDLARARRALDALGDPADWDDLAVVEYYVQEVREALAAPAPIEHAGAGRYTATLIIGDVYEVTLEAGDIDEAREMLEDLDPDNLDDDVTAEWCEVSRHVLELDQDGPR